MRSDSLSPAGHVSGARTADRRTLPSLERRAVHPNAAPPMQVYTLSCMIIRWHERLSDRHGDCGPARASATTSLTRLSLFPYAGEVANGCRSVHGTPSQ